VYLSRRERPGQDDLRYLKVLDDVSFSVGAGEVFGVVGPSGSGKTSLLRVLSSLEASDEGDVLLEGVSIGDVEPEEWRRRVSMVFQTPVMFPGSVHDNIEYPLELDGLSPVARDRRVADCLALVGLSASFSGREARELSQGERQRVAIARAIARAPDVLLMDEPTSALDPTSSRRILELVRTLHGEMEIAIVFVTHVLEQARELCGRVLVLADGRAVEVGAVEQVLEAPSSEIARMFVEGRLEPGSVGDAEANVDGGAR